MPYIQIALVASFMMQNFAPGYDMTLLSMVHFCPWAAVPPDVYLCNGAEAPAGNLPSTSKTSLPTDLPSSSVSLPLGQNSLALSDCLVDA